MARQGAEIRPATAADWPEVRAMGDVYFGRDYLPVYYNWMLHSPNNHPYVVTVDGHVGAFCNYHILEDGHSALTMAKRVAKSYQGRGFTDILKDCIHQDMRSKYPNLDREIYTTLGVEGQLRYQKKNKDMIQIVKRWQIRIAVSNMETLLSATHKFKELSRTCQDIQPLSLTELSRRSPEVLAILRKDSKTFVYGNIWMPHRINVENLRQVAMQCDVLATVPQIRQSRLMSVSFTTTFSSGVGPTANIFYYGESEEDCIDHIKHALEGLERKCLADNKEVAMICHFPQNLSYSAIDSFLSEHLGKQVADASDCFAVEVPFA